MCDHDRLSELDLDVVVQIISLLDVDDVVSLRRTSKHFASVTRLRTIWHTVLVREVLSRDLPVLQSFSNASTDISLYTASELEHATLSSICFERQWQDATPTRSVIKQTASSRTFALRFIGVPEGRYILTFSLDLDGACLEVWDLDAVDDYGERVQSIGSVSEQGRMSGYSIDDEQLRIEERNSCVNIAVAFRKFGNTESADSCVLFILRFDSDDSLRAIGACLQVRKAILCRTPAHVQAMRGNLVVLQVRQDQSAHALAPGALKLVDWMQSSHIYSVSDGADPPTGGDVAVQLLPWPKLEERPVLAVRFIHDWILVFREKSIDFYFLPMHVFIALAKSTRSVAPLLRHAWQWPINSLAVSVRSSWEKDCAEKHCGLCKSAGKFKIVHQSISTDDEGPSAVCPCRYRPLSLVARFDSYYPWPVNLLHHFVLDIKLLSGTRNSWPPEVPYALPPTLTHTIPSTVEMLNPSRLALDAHGMFLWTDNEPCLIPSSRTSTRSPQYGRYVAEQEARQRVAGQRLTLPPPHVYTVRSPAGTAAAADHPEDAVPAQVPAPTLAPWGRQEQQYEQQESATARTHVYASSADDSWCAIDFCAAAGRVAAGYTAGKMEVWDYFTSPPKSCAREEGAI